MKTISQTVKIPNPAIVKRCTRRMKSHCIGPAKIDVIIAATGLSVMCPSAASMATPHFAFSSRSSRMTRSGEVALRLRRL